MELSQIRYFYEAATTQNLSRAAEHLYISQSSLTKSIQKLEEELDRQLFDRVGRRIVLNESGRSFLREIEPILKKLDEIRENMLLSGQNILKKAVIGITGESNALSECLAEFSENNPDIQIEIRCHIERIPRLDISEYDMLLYTSEDEYFEKYSGSVIAKDKLILAVHKNSTFFDRISVQPEEIRDEHLIMLRHNGEPSDADRILLRKGIKPAKVTVVDGCAQQLSLVRAGIGLGLIFESTFSMYGNSDLRQIRLEGKGLQRTISVCFKRDKLLSDTGRLLKEHVTEFFKLK